MLGAPAQGALGIGCRADDEETRISLLKMEDPASRVDRHRSNVSSCNFSEGDVARPSAREDSSKVKRGAGL